MNPNSVQSKLALAKQLNDAQIDCKSVEVIIAPPSLYLIPLKEALRPDVLIAAQNCHDKEAGAFTGEISAVQLKDAGIPYVILGHSERRTLFHETSEIVADKTVTALKTGLSVILCVGETLEQREGNQTDQVVASQLAPVAEKLTEADWEKIVIAYEPVWAIGTGKVATSAQAQETHKNTRKWLSEKVSPKVAEETRIIYGGSVTAGNCRELAQQGDVDGFLVGGASLKPEFADIINAKKAKL